MAKIQNILYKNGIVSIAGEAVQFDKDGIAEIASEEVHKELLGFPNFFPVEEASKEENPKEGVEDKTPPVNPGVENTVEVPKEEDTTEVSKETVEEQKVSEETAKEVTEEATTGKKAAAKK